MKGDFDTGFLSAVSTLTSQWDSTQAVWQDEVARRFEREHWEALNNEIDRFASATAELAHELAYVENALDALSSAD